MRNLPIPHCFNNRKVIIIAFANVANVGPQAIASLLQAIASGTWLEANATYVTLV